MATQITRGVRDSQYNCLNMDLPLPMDDGSHIYGFYVSGVEVNIFLLSGIKLVGVIQNFDGESIQLRNGGDISVHRQAIATIAPPPMYRFTK